jgi:hypothetical protein
MSLKKHNADKPGLIPAKREDRNETRHWSKPKYAFGSVFKNILQLMNFIEAQV